MPINDLLRRIKRGGELLITPALEQWLVDHPEGLVLDDKTADVLWALVTDSSNSDRMARFGASSRGVCLRAQVFTYLGMPTRKTWDPRQQNLFLDGTWRHLRWQMTLLTAGIATHVEYKAGLPYWNVGVSCDAVNLDKEWGVELKGTAALRYVLEHGIPESHMLQMHTCMLATGFTKWAYIAEDKRTQEWREIVIHEDKHYTRLVKAELNDLSHAVEKESLPEVLPSCKVKRGDEYRECPYRDHCPSQRTWPTEPRWS